MSNFVCCQLSWLTLIFLAAGGLAEEYCGIALGMQSGAISDEQLSASTSYNQYQLPSRSRLFTVKTGSHVGGWVTTLADTDRWIQIDFQVLTKISRIDTQGRSDLARWVKTYTLQYGSKENNLVSYRNGKVFTANTDQNTSVSNDLDPPILARFLRLQAKDVEVNVGLRWEVYGCKSEFCEIAALGMASGTIPDSKITASTEFSSNHSAPRSRLGTTKEGGSNGAWTAKLNDTNPWIQVELSKKTTITRVATQGRSDMNQWVKNYTLQYGSNPNNLLDYENAKVFTGNTDQNTTVTNTLVPPIVAKYLRLMPKSSANEWVSLRWELYGCIKEDSCDHSLGMQTGRILDEKISASSFYDANHSPARARLGLTEHGSLSGGWVAKNSISSWIQVDLSAQTTVTRIAIQGHSNYSHWVKTFTLQYGSMDTNLVNYKNSKVLTANTDKDTIVSTVLDPPIIAKYVRLLPKTYHNVVALRLELYGCPQEYCEDALGMQSGAITDNMITASSSWGENHLPSRARLGLRGDGTLKGAWSAASGQLVNSWIQVQFGQQITVSRIATQGRSDVAQWVKNYTLMYGSDNNTLTSYKNNYEFIGNTDQNTVVSHALNPVIYARIVRILPTAYHQHVSMRFELYGGCFPKCKGYTILDSADRLRSSRYTRGPFLCDNLLTGVWCRFVGDAGTQMATSCVRHYYCQTHSTGWMNGTHPSVNQGIVSRKACFSWQGNCCYQTTAIQVRNCGGFYVYKIKIPGWCHYRFCGEKVFIRPEQASVFERVVNVKIPVKRTEGSSLYLPFNYTIKPVSASPATDFEQVSNRLITFSPGQNAVGAPATIKDDDIYEQVETFSFQVANTLPELLVDVVGSPATVSIIDDDDECFTYKVINTDYCSEQQLITGFPKCDTSGMKKGWYRFQGRGGTQISTSCVSGNKCGATTTMWMVSIHPAIAERRERRKLCYNHNGQCCDRFHFVTVRNCGGFYVYELVPPLICARYCTAKVEVKWTDAETSISEATPGITISLSRIGQDIVNLETTVHITSTPLTAIPFSDYLPGRRQTLKFAPGQQTLPVTYVGILNNFVVEADDTFQMVVSTTDGALITNATNIMHIMNDDKVNCTLNATSTYTIPEQAGPITISVSCVGPKAIPVKVGLTSVDIKAKSSTDFPPINVELEFQPPETLKSYQVTITQDSVLEDSETFGVSLTPVDSTRIQIIGLAGTTITIVDDDSVTVEFAQSSYSVNEGDGSLVVKLKMTGLIDDYKSISVGINSKSITAHFSTDYTSLGGTVTIASSSTSPSFTDVTVTITNDNVIESNEEFKLILSSQDNVTNIGAISQTVITILNDDKADVSFANNSMSVFERAGVQYVCILKKGHNVIPVSAGIYVEVAQKLLNTTFRPLNGNHLACGTMGFTDNQVAEYDKKYPLSLRTQDPNVALKGPQTIILTYLNDDLVNISFERASYFQIEDVRLVRINVVCLGLKAVPIKFRLVTINETAIARTNGSTSFPSDFNQFSSLEMEFQPLEVVKSFTVSFTEDSILENDENLLVKLESLSRPFTTITPHEYTNVTIKNDDSVLVEFIEASYNVTEDDIVVIVQVMMNGTTEIDVNVRISTANQSAYSEYDFTGITNQLLTFAPTYSSPTIMNVSVNISHEVLIERREHLKLTMTTSQIGVRLGRNVTEIHILNNDKALMGFIETSLSFYENVGNATVCMFKQGLAAVPLTVLLNTMNNTAKAHLEFEIMTDFLVTFPAPVNKVCVNVTLKDNNITEYNKTFYIIMTTNDPAVIVQHNRSNLTLTILNDDQVTVEFEEINKLTVEEFLEEGKVNLYIVITDGVSVIPVHIDFKENSNEMLVTADHGTDFLLRNDTLTFHPGKTRLTLTIYILHDGVTESDELFSVKIVSPDRNRAVAGKKHLSFVKIKDSRDLAKSVVAKQEQDRRANHLTFVLKMVIAGICLLMLIAIIGVLLVICVILSMFKKDANANE